MSFSNINPQIVEAIPPDVQKTIPVAYPPPGVTPNYLNPISRAPQVVGVSSVFLGLALACYVVRMYTKVVVVKKLSWDDLTVTIGFLLSAAFYGVVVNTCVNDAMCKHLWDVHLDSLISHSSILSAYLIEILLQPALALVKGSLFIQYYTLFGKIRSMRIAIKLGVTVHCVLYTLMTVAIFVLCTPWHGDTFLENTFTKRYYWVTNLAIPIGTIGMVIDWYLLILPIPVVVRLQMTTAKKLGVLAIFTMGGLAAVASTVSLAYRIVQQIDSSDLLWKTSYSLLFTDIELFSGVIVSSMPSVKKFFTAIPTKPTHYSPLTKPEQNEKWYGAYHNVKTASWSGSGDDFDSSSGSDDVESAQIRIIRDVSVVHGCEEPGLKRSSGMGLGEDGSQAPPKIPREVVQIKGLGSGWEEIDLCASRTSL